MARKPPAGPLDPAWVWKLYHRQAPPTPAQARALAAEANHRARAATTAATTAATVRRELIAAMDRSDWTKAGELWRREQDRTSRPMIDAAITAREKDKRDRLTSSGNRAKTRKAANRARRYVTQAKALRRKHPEWTLASIIAHIRRALSSPLSAKQIRRYLQAGGLK